MIELLELGPILNFVVVFWAYICKDGHLEGKTGKHFIKGDDMRRLAEKDGRNSAFFSVYFPDEVSLEGTRCYDSNLKLITTRIF